ncbi:MAG: GNAT family N-acetyltransferase [Proteobacteria bacterium]|nr:MAG: GNAT family N-acetyltransferase [Pseudomonadota bacterium]
MDACWHEKHFDELTTAELYGLIQLRERVFVVEQDCVYLDCDGLDREARHVFATREGAVVACARILAPGVVGDEPAIGRVVTAPAVRGQKLGWELMERAVSGCLRAHGELPIRVSAQSHLEAFYRSLGFIPRGKAYLEDGIPHLEMIRPGSA